MANMPKHVQVFHGKYVSGTTMIPFPKISFDAVTAMFQLLKISFDDFLCLNYLQA